MILNCRPQLVQKLADDDRTRRIFQLKSVPLDVLVANDFDLSKAMGEILSSIHSIDSVVTAKTVFDVLLTPAPSSLDAPGLRILNQRRHLIVHRRCIVDSAYVKATGCTLSIGSELTLTTSDLGEAVMSVHDCGLDLISATQKQL
jgi:hypothetical protein